jgi:cysteine synthase
MKLPRNLKYRTPWAAPNRKVLQFDGLALFWPGYDSSSSHKDYPVRAWIDSPAGKAILKRGRWVIVISSSGNAAYALAKRTKRFAERGGRLVVFSDVLSPPEMLERLTTDFTHVEVHIIDDPDASGSHAAARQRAVDAFLHLNPGAIEISQYGQVGAIGSFWANGYDVMIAEIEAAWPDMTALVLPLGTCATLRSTVAYKLKHGRRWDIIAVDAAGSALTGIPTGKRLFSGFGNGKPTVWLGQGQRYVRRFVKVSDEATVVASRLLLQRDLYMGASAAACVAAGLSLRELGLLPHRGRTVVLCPDHGSLYTSTLYNEAFLSRQGMGQLVAVSARPAQPPIVI